METERTGSEIGKHDIILIASILFVFENFSKVLSKRESRVIATWQHHAIEQLWQSEDIPLLKVSWGPVYLGCIPGDGYTCEIGVDIVPLAALQYSVKSHHFCYRSYFPPNWFFPAS